MKAISVLSKFFLATLIGTFIGAIVASFFDNFIASQIFLFGTLPSFVLSLIFGTIKSKKAK